MENWLRFKGSNNTRDLGGYLACGGRAVASGRLIRSGELSRMSAASCRILKERYDVRTIVDLRTDGEISSNPLPAELRSAAVHIPILQQAMRGITRDSESMKNKMDAIMSSGMSEKKFMQSCYQEMISEPAARNGYRQLFQVLLEQSDGATLFFCSHGRDRTGIAAMLILAALGVSERDICQDYLMTPREYLRKNKAIRALAAVHVLNHAQADFASAWLMPDADRLNGALTWIHQEYGSIDGYLTSGIGLDASDLLRFRVLYLTRQVTI